LIHTAQPSDDL